MTDILHILFELRDNIEKHPQITRAIKDNGLAFTYPQPDGDESPLRHPIKHKDVKLDRQLFIGLGRRKQIIRPDRLGEFEEYNQNEPYPPRLWVLVNRTKYDIARIPVWRGERPYRLPPHSDDEVMAIVRWCFDNDGIDGGLFGKATR